MNLIDDGHASSRMTKSVRGNEIGNGLSYIFQLIKSEITTLNNFAFARIFHIRN